MNADDLIKLWEDVLEATYESVSGLTVVNNVETKNFRILIRETIKMLDTTQNQANNLIILDNKLNRTIKEQNDINKAQIQFNDEIIHKLESLIEINARRLK